MRSNISAASAPNGTIGEVPARFGRAGRSLERDPRRDAIRDGRGFRAAPKSGATARNEALTTALLDRFVTLPINIEVADVAAQLRRDHGWKLPDALQAATALVSGLTLVTRDRKLFRGDARLKVELPYRMTPQR